MKKFLEPNPFLLEAAAHIPPVKRASYLRARISFDEEPRPSKSDSSTKTDQASGWHVSPSRYAVLSSGGKDSLLSFGLLREMRQEVHPIFVNESGRHWFTALNAYRYFAKNINNTARVWTNSDRV
ncbi:MAG: creatininase family protein, partial [Proteobacteria bacterium]|nr:creatininase family protein [Pseudomonadota bacterium]